MRKYAKLTLSRHETYVLRAIDQIGNLKVWCKGTLAQVGKAVKELPSGNWRFFDLLPEAEATSECRR
jgi:hypothetical protein